MEQLLNEVDFKQYIYDDELLKKIENDVDNILEVFSVKKDCKIFSISNGEDYYAKEFGNRGIDVTSCDLDKGKEENLKRWKKVSHKEGFFDIVICMMYTMGSLKNIANDSCVIKQCFKMLNNGGMIIAEVLSREATETWLQPRYWKRDEKTILLCEKSVSDYGDSYRQLTERVFIINKNQNVECDFSMETVLYYPHQVIDMFVKHGFYDVEVSSDLRRSKNFSQEGSMFVIAQKNCNKCVQIRC